MTFTSPSHNNYNVHIMLYYALWQFCRTEAKLICLHFFETPHMSKNYCSFKINISYTKYKHFASKACFLNKSNFGEIMSCARTNAQNTIFNLGTHNTTLMDYKRIIIFRGKYTMHVVLKSNMTSKNIIKHHIGDFQESINQNIVTQNNFYS